MSCYDSQYVEPGKIAEPYHIPGYGGHIPTMNTRNGRSFGQLTREVIEDPCVAQAPIPILAAPMIRCPPTDNCWRNPVGCEDLGCCEPAFCPPPTERPMRIPCGGQRSPPPQQPCFTNLDIDDPRVHYLNRGPYSTPWKREPDQNVYRCCEGLPSSYAGHIPGFTFHSTGRTNGKATFGTKQYMQNCFYMNTFSK